MEKTISKKSIFAAIITIGFFICSDRLMKNLFIWSCSYRMQTMSTILSIAAALMIYILFMRRIAIYGAEMPTGVIIPFCIIYACYFFSSFINAESGVLSRCADSFIFAMAPLMLIAMAGYDKDNFKKFISIIDWVYIVVALVNILFIIWPGLYYVISEWRQNYFIGYHTFLVFPLAVGVMFALLDDYYNGNRIKLIVYMALFIINQGLVKAGGGLIGACIILIYFIPFIRKIFEKTDLAVFIGIIIAVFIVLMWFMGPILNISPIKHIIQDVLHKDLTLTGRLIIWPGVLEDVAKKPIFGYGISADGSIFYDTVYNTGWTKLDGVWLHAHNEFLQTLYEGGIVTLLAAIGMLLFTAKKLRPYNGGRMAGICKMMIFTLLLMLQDDQMVYYPWYIMAFVCQMAAMCCRNEEMLSQ